MPWQISAWSRDTKPLTCCRDPLEPFALRSQSLHTMQSPVPEVLRSWARNVCCGHFIGGLDHVRPSRDNSAPKHRGNACWNAFPCQSAARPIRIHAHMMLTSIIHKDSLPVLAVVLPLAYHRSRHPQGHPDKQCLPRVSRTRRWQRCVTGVAFSPFITKLAISFPSGGARVHCSMPLCRPPASSP